MKKYYTVTELSQYFGKSPKKRDLSDSLKTGDNDSKKPREGSSGIYTDEADILEGDVSQLTVGKFYLTA